MQRPERQRPERHEAPADGRIATAPGPPDAIALLMRLQRTAGNAAVIGMLQRYEAGEHAKQGDHAAASQVLALQRAAGNHAVSGLAGASPLQRENGTGEASGTSAPAPALPKINNLSAMAQALLEGALEQKTVDAAVRKIYDNMFQKTGWRYMASDKDTSGKSYISGGKVTGMCESYRNAFAEILTIYKSLQPSHPEPAIKSGTLDISLGNDLKDQKFATRQGLTLMGASALKGNLYMEVDGSGKLVAQGLDAINVFVFSGHWTLKVNGVEYDPIFHSIGQNSVAKPLDWKYEDGVGQYIQNPSKPTPGNEFGNTNIYITDIAGFRALLAKAVQLDAELSSAGLFGKSKVKKKAKAFFKTTDRDTLRQVVQAGYDSYKILSDVRNAFNRLDEAV